MSGKTLTKILLDIIMFILFVTLIYAYETGLVFHEIAGLSIFALFVSHIFLNWSWVKNVTKNLFNTKLKTSAKLKYALNVTMFLIIATTIMTGIFISQVIFPSLGASLGNNLFLLLHKWSSYLCLGLFALHIVLHGRYLVVSVRKIMANIQESNVGKISLRVGATALIVVVLYSRAISIATKNVNDQSSIYATQIASSTQTTTTIQGRANSSSNQVYENNTNDGGETLSLSDYLESMHCTACPKYCSLLTPKCRKADPQISTAKISYQEQYGKTTS